MPLLFDVQFLQAAALTGALVLATVGARRLAARRIGGGRTVLTPAERRRLALARSLSAAALAIGVAVLWWSELQAVLLSLTAVLVALVIASKELIQCASGAILSGQRGAFRIGDWVEIAGARGEVVDRSLLTTTLIETDDGAFGYGYTGRRLVVPNIQLFAGPARLQRFGRDFVVHRVSVTFDRGPGTAEALHVWQSEAARLCEPFQVRATDARRQIEAGLGAAFGVSRPRARVSTTELGKLRFDAELFCPADQAIAIEARLVTGFLDWLAARAAIAGFARRMDTANANAAASAEWPAPIEWSRFSLNG